jgi:hypothetical protein
VGGVGDRSIVRPSRAGILRPSYLRLMIAGGSTPGPAYTELTRPSDATTCAPTWGESLKKRAPRAYLGGRRITDQGEDAPGHVERLASAGASPSVASLRLSLDEVRAAYQDGSRSAGHRRARP